MYQIVFIFLSFIISFQSLAKDQFVMNYYYNYPPLSWKEEGKMKGIFVDVADEVFKKRMNIDIVHRGYPWARAQKLVETARADGFITMPSKERKSYSLVNLLPVLTSKMQVFTGISNPKKKKIAETVRSISDLKDYRIVFYLGSGWAKTRLQSLDVMWVTNMAQVFKILTLNRADIFIESNYLVDYQMKTKGKDWSVESLPIILDEIDFHFHIQKKSRFKHLINDIDKHLRAMKADGTLDKIIKKYR